MERVTSYITDIKAQAPLVEKIGCLSLKFSFCAYRAVVGDCRFYEYVENVNFGTCPIILPKL